MNEMFQSLYHGDASGVRAAVLVIDDSESEFEDLRVEGLEVLP